MPPRIAILCICAALLGSSLGGGALADGTVVRSGSDASVEVANLKDQLSFGLRARLPSEHAFIALVVERVESGKLPLEMVMSTFQWARRKRPYPFPYFESALRLRAALKGIAL
jgi:hypothetical protein